MKHTRSDNKYNWLGNHSRDGNLLFFLWALEEFGIPLGSKFFLLSLFMMMEIRLLYHLLFLFNAHPYIG